MEEYLKKFRQGMKTIKLVRPIDKNDLFDTDQVSEEYMSLKAVKFVPASGAATRMFKELYLYLNHQEQTPYMDRFFNHISDFAFYKELALEKEKSNLDIVKKVLDAYGIYPKAFIHVHHYGDDYKTPIEEHMEEAKAYLSDVQTHFTISKEHEHLFNNQMKDRPGLTYSFQKPETDTPAVDMNNHLVYLSDGSPLMRPGGHGALIENLNDIDADIIFIKNIDNVCHRHYLETTIKSKKKLASIGYMVKERINTYLKKIKTDDFDLEEVTHFISDVLNIHFKRDMKKNDLLDILDRPLRICGMVKNQGEPGGGPYVVDQGDYTDFQIVEKSEIDLNIYQDILNNASYFNPVDLVCFVKDEKGIKYNLLDFVQKDRYFISHKTYKGKDIKALEHPGLWNGAMGNWNTVFVEVPLQTFNPIKTVNDLLRKGHQL
jgi:hypothetical protein